MDRWHGKEALPCETMQTITQEAEGALPFTSMMLVVGASLLIAIAKYLRLDDL